MPQELNVLRCYACKTFQVQIVKKVPKWQCKMCNEKQSVLKVYARGSGKDCRQYVQDLNMQQGSISSSEPAVNKDTTNHTQDVFQGPGFSENQAFGGESKWSEYLQDQQPSSKDGKSYETSDARDGLEIQTEEMLPRGILRDESSKQLMSKWSKVTKGNMTKCDFNQALDGDRDHEDEYEHKQYYNQSFSRGKKRKFEEQDCCAGGFEHKNTDSPSDLCKSNLSGNSSKSSVFGNNNLKQTNSSLNLKGFDKRPLGDGSRLNLNLCSGSSPQLPEERGSNSSKWSHFLDPGSNDQTFSSSCKNPGLFENQVSHHGSAKYHQPLPKHHPTMTNLPQYTIPQCLNNVPGKFGESSHVLSKSRSPFCSTDDDNLDSLLEF